MLKKLFVAAWIIGILFPMAWASQSFPGWKLWFNTIFAPDWMHILMHALLYAVLSAALVAFLRAQVRGPSIVFLALGLALAVGLLQEGVQLMPSGRLPGPHELFDLAVDMAGAIIGLAVMVLFPRKDARQVTSDE